MAQSRLGKDAILVPIGPTAERPSSPEAGEIRFNTDENEFEGYDGTEWDSIGGAADKVVTANWEIEQEGNDIVFRFDGVVKLKLTSDGHLVAADDITAFGSP